MARPRMRVIHIRGGNEDKLLSSQLAGSLKEALQNYYRNTLIPQGYRHPTYNGNVLTVSIDGNARIYVATEAK